MTQTISIDIDSGKDCAYVVPNSQVDGTSCDSTYKTVCQCDTVETTTTTTTTAVGTNASSSQGGPGGSGGSSGKWVVDI